MELENKNLNEPQASQLNIGAVIPLLRLAGKLALSARLVTTASAKDLSQRVEQMESALDAYENEVISLTSEA